jgi:hypothetical protein
VANPNPKTDSRDSRGQFTVAIETRIRDAEAARMHARGWSYQRIADHYGVVKNAAYAMVQRALAVAGKEKRDEALAIMLTELDMREEVAKEVLARRHVAVSNGRVVHLENDDGIDEPVLDDGPTLAALETLGRITDQRAKLLGLYAPTRAQVQITDAMASEIEQLARELGVNDPTAPAPAE